jgi:hypothetical protein
MSSWPQTAGEPEEISLVTISKNADQRSAMAAKKDERAQDAAQAMREYEAEKLAIQRNTARLRALRLAKEAEQVPPEVKPRKNSSPKSVTPSAKEKTPDPLPRSPKRRKVAAPKRQTKVIA